MDAVVSSASSVSMRTDFEAFFTSRRDHLVQAVAVAIGDADRAADAVDEAMLRAWRDWERVGALDGPGGWVFRVAVNHARSRWRRLRREASRFVPALAEPDVHRRRGPDPADRVSGDPALERALARLSEDHRTVLVMRLVLGHDTATTAAALGLPTGTVKSRLARATKALRDELEGEA